jgi:predicted alpha/beta hydrolase family esterase
MASMSKKAIIFHGTDCKPTDFWYPWIRKQLQHRGFTVDVPSYPTINHESIATFLPKVLEAHAFDENTIIIGHSAGGPLLLSILENVDAVLQQAILVAGYSHRLPGEETDPVLQESYDWDTIKRHVKDIVFINSVDDPWGCNAEQGRFMFDRLGGTQVIRNDGHFGSTHWKQPYPTFEILDHLID